jgi:predicted small integral membrane protein
MRTRSLALAYPIATVIAFALAVGFGAVTAVLWEFAFIRNSSELDTAYTDALGDLALGLSGSTVAALLTVRIMPRVARDEG